MSSSSYQLKARGIELVRTCLRLRAFYPLFFTVFALLSSCSEPHGPAPVIDAWYQSNAASPFYVVRQDDTIYSIAFSFGLDYRDLVAVNHLTPPYRLMPGQRLIMTHRPPHSIVPPRPVSSIVQQPFNPQPVAHPILEESHVTFHNRWHWPARGRLLQRFSTRPDGHPGISIGGKLGEPVRAAANGVVVYSGDGVRGYGNLIIIKHNESYLSAYANNLQNLVMVGERVRAGSVIARMGHNDANRTLLYFEIRRDGVPVDPLRFLK